MNPKRKKRNNLSLGLIAHSHSKSSISEQYRLIRTNIEFASIDKNIKTIVITSPTTMDGKTTTAINLSIVLAQQGKRVLLVDADLRKPSIHYAFQLNNMNGLTSVLAKKISLEKAITTTHVSNLNILTSGPIPPAPSELLNSKTMESVIEELNNTFDYIVFDTSPVLSVADSQVLASKCDGIVMVVSSGKTKKEEAVKTKEVLQKTRSHLLGVVLNEVEPKDITYNY